MFDGKGNNQHSQDGLTKQKAASDAGLSRHQKDQAVNMANLMAEDFEKLVETKKPHISAGLHNLQS